MHKEPYVVIFVQSLSEHNLLHTVAVSIEKGKIVKLARKPDSHNLWDFMVVARLLWNTSFDLVVKTDYVNPHSSDTVKAAH